MNRAHHLYCASRHWARTVENDLIPWGLDGVDLGDDVLEIGPGKGVTTRVLAPRVPNLTIIEIEGSSAEKLRDEFAPAVEVIEGDATAMPLPDDRFSGAACFTMLHHVPSRDLQDKVLAEAFRVLRAGGVLAGTDSLGGGLGFWLLHIADTFVPVAPEGLPDRLRAAGFADPKVETNRDSLRFAARKPG